MLSAGDGVRLRFCPWCWGVIRGHGLEFVLFAAGVAHVVYIMVVMS